MDKRFWAIIGALLVLFFGFVTINNNSKEAVVTTPTNHVFGKADSSVVLVNYSDFQCPACQSFASTVEQVREKYKDSIAFQFRHLPLTQIHQNAFAASRASEAADKQGKFWEMHDLLFDRANWQVWTTATDPTKNFEQYARSLKLDITKYTADFKSEAVNGSINADIAEFDKTGEEKATPTFFINGRKIDSQKLYDAQGLPSVDAFSKIIDAELAKQ
jgi:protein-disulfide isomerase